MPSKIIGKISFDDALLQRDLETIATFPHLEEAYPEFGVGSWRNHSLWNKSGNYRDLLVEESIGKANVTELGMQLPYINQMIRETFDTTHLKLVRTRNLIDGIVFPHKDFVELSKDKHYLRVFIPLKDNKHAYHSDEYSIFQMKKGEIWQLDAAIIHAAVNFGLDSRIHLCFDFHFPNAMPSIESIFLNPETVNGLAEPMEVKRIPKNHVEVKIKEVASQLTRARLHDALIELSKIHFQYDVHIADCYDWLINAAQESGDPDLPATCKKLKHFMIIKRDFGEKFSFEAHAVS